ncbi:MAG: ASKHA domain-containing protein [Candidatus Odinarchaeia archaeon]
MGDIVKIRFLPYNKVIQVRKGANLLSEALNHNIPISSLCGGRGVCGSCKVIVLKGKENLSEITEKERMLLSDEEIKNNYRLACLVNVLGDSEFKIPEETLYLNFNLIWQGYEPKTKLAPAVKKLFLALSPPSFEESAAYDIRVLNAIKKRISVPNLRFTYETLKVLPSILKAQDWKVTVVIVEDKIIGLEGGNTENKTYGIAVDIGSTKIAVFLVNLKNGELVASASEINPQTKFGEDIISRISYIMKDDGNLKILNKVVVEAINKLIDKCCSERNISTNNIYEVVVAGNTVMTHIFLGISPTSLAWAPYVPAVSGPQSIPSEKIGIKIHRNGNVYVFPSIAGFVGGDAVAGVLATRIHKHKQTSMLIDVGTNTEIVMGNSDNLVCSSTASGPAFEGASIKFGMKAASGAIEKVKIDDSTFEVYYETIDEEPPVGICGSGIIDAVAELVRVGVISPDGAFRSDLKTPRLVDTGKDKYFILVYKEDTKFKRSDIYISQQDIRQIQKAKAAIQATYLLLMKRLNFDHTQLSKLYLAGAFGLYINPRSAQIIGLLPEISLNKVKFVGNTAGSGARLALKNYKLRKEIERIANKVQHVEIAVDKSFQKEWIKALYFPHADLKLYPKTKNILKLSNSKDILDF